MSTLLSLDGVHSATEDLLREHGVTHGPDLPWRLDPLPLVVDAQDWLPLERAVAQRTHLLDLILLDLTTERKLLTTGMLPPDIVASSPAFLRPAMGLALPGPHQLHCAATDVVRNADGAWTALADRTGVPTGLGYAMEDRRVVSQVMASRYREQRVRRIGPFFRALRRALEDVAPAGADAPRIAVLTPGPSSAAAFDHAYLAAMLGVPLVEGEDLVVEDGRLWSRTLDVREPLDVLVSRVDAAQVDPLELAADSPSGTPGIVHAIREGTLSVVNPLAAGLLESPVLLTYLPKLARHLLGEELALPSVATYWCGDRSMCSHVIANVNRLTLRSARDGTIIDTRALSIARRADVCARISSEPWAWVGQEPVEPSEAPSLGPDGVQILPIELRTFTVAQGEGWAVMPGGLARVGDPDAGPDRPAKDVWVIAAEPAEAEEEAGVLLPGLAPSSVITPRAAEDLHLLGRHVERAESLARLLRVAADRWDDYHGRTTSDRPDVAGRAALVVLLEAVHARAADADLPDLVTGAGEGTLAHAVASAHRNARAVPDLLPRDAWPAFAGIERELRRMRAVGESGRDGAGLGAPLSRVLTHLLALTGVMDESMVRDAGWHLLEAGRRIERAHGVVATLAGALGREHPPEVERLLIDSTLMVHESVLPYRRRFLRGGATGVWELLLTDPSNPRSLRFQLDRITRALDALPGRAEGTAKPLGDIADILAEAPLRWDDVAADGSRRVAEDLESIQWRLHLVSEAITARWFARPHRSAWSGDGQ